jgi:hypothetical protein
MARLKHNENTTFKSNVRLMDETQITEAIKWVKVSKNLSCHEQNFGGMKRIYL